LKQIFQPTVVVLSDQMFETDFSTISGLNETVVVLSDQWFKTDFSTKVSF
jgi:hypothetical protein